MIKIVFISIGCYTRNVGWSCRRYRSVGIYISYSCYADWLIFTKSKNTEKKIKGGNVKDYSWMHVQGWAGCWYGWSSTSASIWLCWSGGWPWRRTKQRFSSLSGRPHLNLVSRYLCRTYFLGTVHGLLQFSVTAIRSVQVFMHKSQWQLSQISIFQSLG